MTGRQSIGFDNPIRHQSPTGDSSDVRDLIKRGQLSPSFYPHGMDGLPDEAFNPLDYVEPVDLIQYGLIPEFVGRLPVVASVSKLDEHALVRVLTEPKNSLLMQYQGLFAMNRIQLHFTHAALMAVARQAIQKQTGARGLRRIMVRGEHLPRLALVSI